MVLSAGLGTRMRPLTDHLPKPLLQVAGATMLDRALDHVEEAGIDRAVVNLHYLGQMIQDHLTTRAKPAITYSDETEELLETGGGVVKALPLLGDLPFVTMNSDAIWHGGNPIAPLIEAWEEGTAALLLLVPRDHAIGYTRPGDFFLEGDRPVRRGDRAMAPYVYSGVQIIRPDVFAGAPAGPFSMNIIWNQLLARDAMRAVVYDGRWVDVGTPAGLALADDLVGGRS
ncbi:nucleotidyltransferase family protein [Rhodobacteraceae bacterium NNCM2]|nr:nucleotidyltransferase family protein [Coraliihabitans acroporae]